jgi:membrane protein required for colicin V production
LVLSGVTQFDLLVAALLLISAAVGFARGATREIAALVALLGAAAFAVFGLPVFTPMLRKIVHPDWLATVATLILVFIGAYIALRLVGGAVAGQIQRSNFIGTLDRSVGLAIGLARGLIVLGALNLMFNAATPEDLQPKWITGATTWPLAQNMGRALKALAPKGLDVAGRLKPAFDRALGDALGDRSATDGYDARQRGEIDDLVEKSR